MYVLYCTVLYTTQVQYSRSADAVCAQKENNLVPKITTVHSLAASPTVARQPASQQASKQVRTQPPRESRDKKVRLLLLGAAAAAAAQQSKAKQPAIFGRPKKDKKKKKKESLLRLPKVAGV